MSQPDLSFAIERIESFHLRFRGAYWEDYRKDEVASRSARFEFRQGWQTVYATTIETAITKVTLRDGTVGWGEPNVPIGPEVYCLVADQLVGEMAAGREFADPGALWRFLYDAQRGRGYLSGYWLDALAGVDLAVWDALGNREGLPVAALTGRDFRRTLSVYLSGLRQATVEARVQRANEWIDSGGRGAKIFLTGDLDSGLSELAALQRGAPRMQKWMVDTLWMLNEDTAPRAKGEFGELGVEFLECPLQPEDLAGHRALWRQPGAPIALGEHFRTSYQVAEWCGQPQALDVYQPDVGRTGISDGMRQLDLARDAGLAITPHMGNGGAVFQAATFHFSSLCPGTHLQEWQAGLAEKMGDAVDTGWRYANGEVAFCERPGLGVRVHEDKLERFAVRR